MKPGNTLSALPYSAENACFELAITFSATLHGGQVDKLGEPFSIHWMAVASSPGLTVEERTVAVLHDVPEDCGIHILNNVRALFGDRIADAVAAITKTKNEPYKDYLARVKANPMALKVKLADIAHNTSPDRLDRLPPEVQNRLRKKYASALEFLRTPQTPDSSL